MDTVAIIQARMGSTRLPGKVLMDICGKPMLQHVIERVSRARVQVCYDVPCVLDNVVVATTTLDEDDAIVKLCNRLMCPCFRGSADDVLARYAACAKDFEADVVVRVTADCPLIDVGIMHRVIGKFISEYPKSCFACTDPHCWPNGVDVEVFTSERLYMANRYAEKEYERAHVTPWMREFGAIYVRPPDGEACHPEMRWTVDEQADLDFVREIYRRGWQFRATQEIIDSLFSYKNLTAINAHVRQKDVTEC